MSRCTVKVLALSNCSAEPVSPLAGARLAARGEGSGRGGVAAGRAGDARGNGKGRESRRAALRHRRRSAEFALMSATTVILSEAKNLIPIETLHFVQGDMRISASVGARPAARCA